MRVRERGTINLHLIVVLNYTIPFLFKLIVEGRKVE